MPYLRCPDCGTLTYSAASWSGIESCPRCDRALPRAAHRRPAAEHSAAGRPGALTRASLIPSESDNAREET